MAHAAKHALVQEIRTRSIGSAGEAEQDLKEGLVDEEVLVSLLKLRQQQVDKAEYESARRAVSCANGLVTISFLTC